MDFSSISTGQRVKYLRKQLGLTQSIFAGRIRRERSTIAKIEADEIELSPAMRQSICNEFNVREEWMLTGCGDLFYIDNRKALEPDAPAIHGIYQTEFRVSEALTMCARVLESGTSYATALYLNIQHFDRAVSAEERMTIFEKNQADIEARSRDFELKMQARFQEMETKLESLQGENKKLRKEVNRLKATYEDPDGGEGNITNVSGQ